MGASQTLEVPFGLERTMYTDREQWERSALFALQLLSEAAGRSDLGEADLLDVGCGTKLVKVLLDRGLPIGSYTGVDASAKVIRWLTKAVADPRFAFAHLDARNEMYNPDGTPLGRFEALPVGGRSFDVICAFSLFTHLEPADFEAMLALLRRHARPGTTLLFSLYVTRPDGTGVYRTPEERPPGARFVDELPDQPLAVARYDDDYARELIAAAGWELESLNPPGDYIQHYAIARPA